MTEPSNEDKSFAFPLLNRVYIAGKLTHDPPLRYTKRGVPVTNFVIETVPDTKETEERKACQISVVVWAQQAIECTRTLKKDHPVFISGELQSMPNADPAKGHFPVQINALSIQTLHQAEEANAPAQESDLTVDNQDQGNDQGS